MRWLVFAIALLICVAHGRIANAGLASPNVIVVVNAKSADSITLANHYVALREIPPSNVVWLDNVPNGLTISLDDFRERVLQPILTALNKRKLAAQAQVIAYSAGFPTSVRINEHTDRLSRPDQQKYQTPTASLNSMTFFYRWVLADQETYLGWTSNLYARGPFKRHFANPFGGDAGKRFDQAEQLATEGKHEQAAEKFAVLAGEFPKLSALSIRSAELYSEAKLPQEALDQVRAAIRSGWVNRRHLTETPSLARLFSENAVISTTMAARRRILDQLVDRPIKMQGPVGFDATLGWTSSGAAVSSDSGAMPYLLSCLLGVVHPNGSTLSQAIEVLKRSARSDRTYPDATFGYARTDDVRTKTRNPSYADALAWLLNRDQTVEVFSAPLPTGKDAYVGLCVGAARLNFGKRSWRFVPGSIADNLTSLGAVFSSRSQTHLTELLHAGAAMSSGAVAEPYSVPFKFPHPMMYAYYAEGATAVEAFYLSVRSPYQLLIVGDPLCQPFARPPTDFVRAELPSSEQLELRWQRMPESRWSTPTEKIDWFIDGHRVARTRPQPKLVANFKTDLQGEVPISGVLTGVDPTQPRIAFHFSIKLGEVASFPIAQRLRRDLPEKLTIYADCPDAERIEIEHLGRTVGEIAGEGGRVALEQSRVGRGPVRLRAIGYRDSQKVLGPWTDFDW